jgi:hypothetical protein
MIMKVTQNEFRALRKNLEGANRELEQMKKNLVEANEKINQEGFYKLIR